MKEATIASVNLYNEIVDTPRSIGFLHIGINLGAYPPASFILNA